MRDCKSHQQQAKSLRQQLEDSRKETKQFQHVLEESKWKAKEEYEASVLRAQSELQDSQRKCSELSTRVGRLTVELDAEKSAHETLLKKAKYDFAQAIENEAKLSQARWEEELLATRRTTEAERAEL